MAIEIPSYVSDLMKTLLNSRHECFVVGGAVRSALLCAEVHDYDLTTDALPDEMKEIFSSYRTIETGIRHGTLTVLSEGKPVEITTYRKDSTYSDHRHPDQVEFTSRLQEDCARRDFTVNALCADIDGNLYDFFEGRKDLKQKLIRCIGSADERFDEDALRILRALRFAARLGFQIEKKTSDALRRKKDLLLYISAERIRDELTGFLNASGCAELFEEYDEVFEVIIPKLKQLNEEEKKQLFGQLKRSENDHILRLALIVLAAGSQEEIMKSLKMTNHEMKDVSNLLSLSERPLDTLSDIRRIKRDLKQDFKRYALFRYALDEKTDVGQMMNLNRMIIENGDCYSLKDLAVRGNDLKELGFCGKEISKRLNQLLEDVIDSKLANEKEVLLDSLRCTKQ